MKINQSLLRLSLIFSPTQDKWSSPGSHLDGLPTHFTSSTPPAPLQHYTRSSLFSLHQVSEKADNKRKRLPSPCFTHSSNALPQKAPGDAVLCGYWRRLVLPQLLLTRQNRISHLRCLLPLKEQEVIPGSWKTPSSPGRALELGETSLGPP